MVLDAGGGTSCIVRYILTGLSPPQFKQEFASESEFSFRIGFRPELTVLLGLTWAAEKISSEFEKLIDGRLPLDYPNRAWVIEQMRRKWDELYKHPFDGNDPGMLVSIKRPGAEFFDEFS